METNGNVCPAGYSGIPMRQQNGPNGSDLWCQKLRLHGISEVRESQWLSVISLSDSFV
jgi:hypothetical protein